MSELCNIVYFYTTTFSDFYFDYDLNYLQWLKKYFLKAFTKKLLKKYKFCILNFLLFNNIRNLIIQKSGTMKIKYVEPESQNANIYVNSYFYDYIMGPRQKFVLPTK